METMITYRCKICGYESPDSSKIKKCEVQGFSPRLEAGQTVYLNFTGHPEFKEDFVLVKILEVSCKKQTHEPVYSLEYQVNRGGLRKGDVVTDVGEDMLFRLREEVFVPLNENTLAAAIPVNKIALSGAAKKREEMLKYVRKVTETSP